MNEEYIITRRYNYLGESISYKIKADNKKLIKKVRRGEVKTPIHIALKRFNKNMSKEKKLRNKVLYKLWKGISIEPLTLNQIKEVVTIKDRQMDDAALYRILKREEKKAKENKKEV